MKFQVVVKGLLALLLSGILQAQGAIEAIEDNDKSSKLLRPDSLHGFFSYTDFDFNNSTPFAISKFEGHSYLSLVGGNNMRLDSKTNAGLFFYNVYTNLSFTQSALTSTSETINANNFFAHVLRQVHSSVAIDLVGGYGQNSLQFKTLSTENPSLGAVGSAKGHGNNWFVNAKGLYTHSWTNVMLLASLGILHTEVTQNPFYFFLNASPLSPNYVDTFTSKQSFVLEYAELTYKKSGKIQPFVNAGLLQVVQYANVTPAAAILSAATLPNSLVNLNVNGYSVGAGLSWEHKKLLLRLEEQYYQRGSIYHSNQSIVSIRYLL